ncbi:39S ribosomal protein L32, mitochondrial [Eufriesea mexicana]|uniref:39S ribosomal protein L32, mitochondrial n=1 Tax=Eufriesea mexicana TaxID=516756 RepID=UPI00083C037E|nr:PREDICTED: 39S ribosomal protein L32, mitochondrial [Eufriesea mexicana]OAD53903.1 39S ribosomal protein L32, mitochondrial [Eufriesea mexicana]
MANGIFARLCRVFKTFDQAINVILGHKFPPGNLYAIEYNAINQVQPTNFPGLSIKDTLKEAVLWAAPTKRRTIEKRLSRRFGVPKYNWKPFVPKTNILMCRKCGHDYIAGTLCGYCYEIVKKETKEMQEAIQDSLKLDPVEQNVIVLYQGEREKLKDNFWKNQRIVELNKKRPDWFSANLLQPISEELPESEVTPIDKDSDNIKQD